MNGITAKHLRRPHGAMFIYCVCTLIALCALISLGVDYGHAQLVKTELQRAADAAARYACAGLATGTTTATSNAKTAASDNKADGTSVNLKTSDIEFGKWDASTNTFTVLSSTSTQINAVRVTAWRRNADDNGVPLMFASVLGKRTIDVRAQSIAMYSPTIDINLDVPEASNPWLAGMPDGTKANPNPPPKGSRLDQAGPYTDSTGTLHPTGESPAQMTGVNLQPGMALTFDAISGTGKHGANYTLVPPDGDTTAIFSNDAGAENGKSNISAPIDSVVAVFLDNNVPSGTTPANLDYSSAISRDFTSVSPKLRQVFYIGDGKTSGGTAQSFIVPAGATRLFIGKMDGFEWNNNSGSTTVTIHKPAQITIVK